MSDNPWSEVTPLTPTAATYEMAFLVLDVTQQENAPDMQEVSQRIAEILNGVYLQGWQECHIRNAAAMKALIAEYTK